MHRIVEFLHPALAFKHFARARSIRRTHALLYRFARYGDVFTRIDTSANGVWHGRITVPRQSYNHKTYAFTGSFAAVRRSCKPFFNLAIFIARRFQQLFVILCLSLLPPEIAHLSDFVFRNERAMDPVQPRRTRR